MSGTLMLRMPTMSASFTLTYPEFKQAVRAIEGASSTGRLTRALFFVTLVGGGLLAFYLVVGRRAFGPSPTLGSALSDSAIGMLIAAYVGWRAYDYVDGRFRRLWARANSLRAEQSVSVAGKSLCFGSGEHQRLNPIASYTHVVETKDVVVLIAPSGADVIAKRAMDDAVRAAVESVRSSGG
jgi:hypothetical protein